MDLGPHAGTIIACYGIVAGVLAGLVIWLIVDGRRLAASIMALEQRGIRRRSAGGASTGDVKRPEPEPNKRA